MPTASASQLRTKLDPMKPVPPVISTVLGYALLSTSLGLSLHLFSEKNLRDP